MSGQKLLRRGESLSEVPKISVVTPSFNQAEYLEETIKSVLGQGYSNLEYIIIDGGSTDGSVEIIERYSEHLAYWISELDGGQTDALIKGFEKSSGEIMAWLNSDDLYEPGALFEVAEAFARNPEWQVVYGDSYWMDAESQPTRPKKEIGFNRFIWLYDHNYLPQPSTFWRRGIYERVGGLDPQWDLVMDADLWIRFAEHTVPRHVLSLWSRMRYYPEQKNRRLRDKSDEEGEIICGRYLPPEPRWKRRVKRIAAKGLRVTFKVARGAYW